MKPAAISIDTASAITNLSRRTWWRRIAEQGVMRAVNDDHGRTMLWWAEVEPHIVIPMTAENHESLFLADTGSADAQNAIGQFFMRAAQHKAAFYWFQQASKQGHPDAMHWLAYCYFGGNGVEKNDYLGLMWVAKAAALGHVTAQSDIKRRIRYALESHPSS